MSEVSHVLREAASVVSAGWCQHELAKTAKGKPVDPWGRWADRRCIIGTIMHVTGCKSHRDKYDGLTYRTLEALARVTPGRQIYHDTPTSCFAIVSKYNDAQWRTRDEVRDFLLEAADQLEDDE